MRDLNRALTDISVIRGQLARDAEFRGYGPATLAATGVLAWLAAGAQALWLKDPAAHVQQYVMLWVATAVLSLIVIGIETVQRSRRAHGALAIPMLQSAVEQFMPALVAGGLLTVVLLRVAAPMLWVLPGLWQVVFSLGVFASCRFLPRPMFLAGVWYLVCGLGCLGLLPPEFRFSPWVMGVPYGVGQLLVACILKRNPLEYGDDEQLQERE
ncbi:MAG TPA: hypothetical protein VHN17_09935 [Steroidobacteraceae bacterium]|jgi:hypothetical protein|nr:hypothetical protein [Steroidobacteraceae bacterium]